MFDGGGRQYFPSWQPGIWTSFCLTASSSQTMFQLMINKEIVPGAYVGKGQELGHFQFGGSTHVLMFQPGKIKEFVVNNERDDVKMGEPIAYV